MNDYPFEAEDMIIEVLEENRKQIASNRYPANETLTVLMESDIPVNTDVVDLAEEWLTNNGILYNPVNFGRE